MAGKQDTGSELQSKAVRGKKLDESRYHTAMNIAKPLTRVATGVMERCNLIYLLYIYTGLLKILHMVAKKAERFTLT